MSNTQQYGQWITELLKNNGPMGVTAIGRQLDLPITSVQHYLTNQQNTLMQLPDKKWNIRPRLDQAFNAEAVDMIKKASLSDLVKEYEDIKKEAKEKVEMQEALYHHIQERMDEE